MKFIEFIEEFWIFTIPLSLMIGGILVGDSVLFGVFSLRLILLISGVGVLLAILPHSCPKII